MPAMAIAANICVNAPYGYNDMLVITSKSRCPFRFVILRFNCIHIVTCWKNFRINLRHSVTECAGIAAFESGGCGVAKEMSVDVGHL